MDGTTPESSRRRRPGEVFHAGERAVQARMGVREMMAPWGRRIVQPQMPPEHATFFAELPYVVVAARDRAGRPWVTMLAGAPGFVRALDPGALQVGALPVSGDALDGALARGADVGVLGIELQTRRRNRLNGRLGAIGPNGFVVEVDQSFGNCPQYIHERPWAPAPADARPPRREVHPTLTADVAQAIRAADTFFIASGYRGDDDDDPAFGMDASHRGGPPGFVEVAGDRRLVFPDYSGNNHFNTIGNLVLDARVGLLFVDFEGGGLVQITGRATVDWDSEAVARHPGARRLVAVDVDEVVVLRDALPIRFGAPGTGVRALRVVGRRVESDDVVSLALASRDGGPLPDFEAGQHLPIELRVPGEAGPTARTYSLSSAPADAGLYRITVKRHDQGVGSRFLHDRVTEGDFLDARSPGGGFVLPTGGRPLVLVSAGIGLTPLVSMLRQVVLTDDPRHVWFIHGARDGAHHPLADEVRHLARAHPTARLHVRYSAPRPGSDVLGRDHDAEGRVDARTVVGLLPTLDADFFLVGPPGFMGDVYDGLQELGVPEDRIRTESFGPGVPAGAAGQPAGATRSDVG